MYVSTYTNGNLVDKTLNLAHGIEEHPVYVAPKLVGPLPSCSKQENALKRSCTQATPAWVLLIISLFPVLNPAAPPCTCVCLPTEEYLRRVGAFLLVVSVVEAVTAEQPVGDEAATGEL